MTVLPAIGYDHPDQSHFTSRHYWEVGATDPRLLTGWLGRYLDIAGVADNPLQGLSITGNLEPSLATAKVPVAAIDGPNQYSFGAQGVWGSVAGPHARRDGRARQRALARPGLPDRGERRPTSPTACAASCSRSRSRTASPRRSPTRPANDGFTTGLQGVAAMIAANLPLRCVALEASGSYDTHAGQAAALTPALTTTAASLYSFQRDLEARGIADRVLTLVWSEFGRRAQENGSGGTDHGAAGTAFLIGSRAIGTAIGEFPGLVVARRRRQPEADLGLPLRLQLAARAVAAASTPPG